MSCFMTMLKRSLEFSGLTLTSRDKGENPIPMAGFPHHQLDGYLAKLIRSGFRVAVCEQVEDPREAKGIVKREVQRIVTAGTLTEDSLLDPRASICWYPFLASQLLTEKNQRALQAIRVILLRSRNDRNRLGRTVDGSIRSRSLFASLAER